MKKIKYLLLALLMLPTLKVNAANGTIDIYASNKNVTVGNNTTVTVYCKSSSAIGTCEYTLTYDSSKLKLISGDLNVIDVASDSSTTQLKRTYTFKVIATGSSQVSVKSYAIRDFVSEEQISTSVDPVTITGVSPSKPNNSNSGNNSSSNNSSGNNYSTNNNLKSLSIEGQKLTPEFSKDKTEYTINLDSNIEKIKINAEAEDNKAKIEGIGEINLTEGENKIEIKVTSEKGTTKTYIIKAIVKDENPIKVTINNEEYSVVKRKSSLEKPDNFIEKEIKINNITIPAFYNEKTKNILVGLKDKNSKIALFIYDDTNNKYYPYILIIAKTNSIIPTTALSIPDNFIKTTIKINEKETTAYKISASSIYSYIYGKNIETGEESWYRYEETENTLQKYNDSELKYYEEKINDSNNIIMLLSGILIFTSFVLIITLFKKNKKRKPKSKEIKDENNTNENIEKTIKQYNILEDKTVETEIIKNKKKH